MYSLHGGEGRMGVSLEKQGGNVKGVCEGGPERD